MHYELLRPRCKYIVVIDGEHDPWMTFAAITTLQRRAMAVASDNERILL